MDRLAELGGLGDIAARYDALYCDAWGVIHNGVELFPHVADCLSRFRAERGPVIILTNAPRPSSVIPAQLDRIGLPRAAYDAIVTSGDATRAELEKRKAQPAMKIGPSKDDPLFEGLALDFAGSEGAEFIICTGLEDDQSETPEDYRPLLEKAALRRLPMICANPDILVNWGGRMVWCAGALADLYAKMGGEVIYGGKPHPPIYGQAHRTLIGLGGDRARILAIGDGPGTDILGANNAGIDALFIVGEGGVHEGGGDRENVIHTLERHDARAVGYMEGLAW